MRLLHTSDWHLGHTINDRRRDDEMEAFFSFLRETITNEKIEALLISGDIFDSSAPSNAAQSAYFDFLSSLEGSCCKDVFIIAGNHDSPSLLEASRNVLKRIRVHVFTSVRDMESYVLDGKVIILPIPFPRDQELRTRIQGETFQEEECRYRRAIENLYKEQTEKALALSLSLPIVAMGHLMASNVSSEEKDALYVGGVGAINGNSFPSEICYVALGHIHRPQKLNAKGTICYSGSPIPFSFKEAKDQKTVKVIDIDSTHTEIKDIPVPVFRKLFFLSGSSDAILAGLKDLVEAKETGWVSYDLTEGVGAAVLKEKAEGIVENTGLEIVQTRNSAFSESTYQKDEEAVDLDSLSPEDIFMKYMEARGVEEGKKEGFLSMLKEVMATLDEEEER